jgi:hypothetical protein
VFGLISLISRIHICWFSYGSKRFLWRLCCVAKTFEAGYFSITDHFILLLIYIIACKIILFLLTSLLEFVFLLWNFQICVLTICLTTYLNCYLHYDGAFNLPLCLILGVILVYYSLLSLYIFRICCALKQGIK